MIPAMDEPQPVEFLLDDYPDAIRQTGMALRSLIFHTVAGTVETIRPGWRWIAYSLPDGKRVRNFAWIGPELKHIHLGFEHGTLLADYPSAIRETGRALRELILGTVPGTVETIRPGWRWIAYSLPDGKRVRNFAWIGPERKHIHLGFEHGTLLADPDRILHGAEERLKKFRYFTFEPSIDIERDVLADYVRRAADLATMPSSARRALAETSAEPFDPAHDGIPADIELELVD